MRVRVKICGVTTPEAIEAAVAAGADAIGFVLAADSPRRLDLAAARRLAALVPPFVVRVAVLRHPTPDEARAVVDALAPDLLQAEPSDALQRALDGRVRLLPVLHDDPDLLSRLPVEAPLVLLEAEGRGGRGIPPDHARAAAAARRVRLVLAGGLTPENVGAAIAAVRPFAVDVSSGVESAPGVKDPHRIAAFIAAVRRAAADISPDPPVLKED
jgi:phosphoribosylanthranilate isomerase